MLRTLFIVLALTVGTTANEALAESAAPRINCDAPYQRDFDFAPRTTGPLRLAAVYCTQTHSGSSLFGEPLVSPDAQSIASYADLKRRLIVSRLDGGRASTEYTTPLGTFRRFGSNFRAVLAFAWRSDSKAVWTGTHEEGRGGFPKSELRPVQAQDGQVTPMPALRSDAGPLDGLLWVGGDGIALAQFGTRGDYYQPSHRDRSPTLAMVDVPNGVVLDTLPFSAVLKNLRPDGPYHVFIHNAAATLRDGKVRAVVDIGDWLVWTQGEAPRTLPNPYAREMHGRMAIAPDGARVLITRLLRTDGGWCSEPSGGCRPGKPVEGILAALHDLNTGELVWNIRARVTADLEFPTPAISPDGRYALVAMVPDGRAMFALVSMRDGAILQTVPAPDVMNYAMGFAQGGRTIWSHAHGMTALYELSP